MLQLCQNLSDKWDKTNYHGKVLNVDVADKVATEERKTDSFLFLLMGLVFASL